MALDTPGLESGIKSLTDDLFNNPGNLTPDQARQQYATRMSQLIETFVKSGTVNVTVTVTTTGTATAQSGGGPGTGTVT